MISSTVPLQYSCYYKWCHFRQDRHKQTISSELPIVIKLAIFQTIHSLSPSVTFQSPALSKIGLYYLSCTTVHFQEKARIIAQILFNYTGATSLYSGEGTNKSSWHMVQMCVLCYTEMGRVKSMLCNKDVTGWMPSKRMYAVFQLVQLPSPGLDNGFQRHNWT